MNMSCVILQRRLLRRSESAGLVDGAAVDVFFNGSCLVGMLDNTPVKNYINRKCAPAEEVKP
jgi:hypothetical protein